MYKCYIQYLPQRVESFVHVFLLGRNVDKHQGLAVAPETVLQQVGQLGVPVWHVGRLLRQSHDDIAEV